MDKELELFSKILIGLESKLNALQAQMGALTEMVFNHLSEGKNEIIPVLQKDFEELVSLHFEVIQKNFESLWQEFLEKKKEMN